MAFSFWVDGAAVGAPGEVHTTAKNKVGTVRKSQEGFEYIYLSGAASLTDGEFVTYIPGTFAAVRLVAGAKGSVAIATAAIAAAEYGWFMIVGEDSAVKSNSTIVSNAHVFATATTGVVDDAVVKNDQIKGARTTTAGVAGGTCGVAVNRPFIGSHDESA